MSIALSRRFRGSSTITRAREHRRLFVLLLCVVGWCETARGGLFIGDKFEHLAPPIIQAVQKRLTELGFSPGTADGRWGPKTRQSFEAFCEAKKLAPSDRLTPEQIKALWDVDFDPQSATGDESMQFMRRLGVQF